MASSDNSYKKLAANRKALRDYSVVERFEAGIELKGTEVKSVKAAKLSMSGAYAKIENGEAFLFNLNIPLYEFGNRFNHEPSRQRRLLLHSAEIRKLQAQIEQKGMALVPLSIYLKHGKVKVELGLCKGKRLADKRETLKRKTADREAERAMKKRY